LETFKRFGVLRIAASEARNWSQRRGLCLCKWPARPLAH
jgi:hypothetical protein